jgi:ACR3 family arsenite efflux pump ArsB
MALLGTVFIGWLFRPLLPADQVDSYIAGLILLAAAPCTAMVFVWSNLCEGEPHYTLSQVALNDLNAGLAYWLSRKFGVAWCVAAPAALIGASNFFELAVAAATSLFGIGSGAALATVVGVLVEVPVMLTVVALVKRSRGWYEAAA